MLVVKLGGSKGINIEAFCDEVARLQRDRIPMVVVHGGSHLTNEVAEKLGHPAQFVTSPSGFTSRRTDKRTLEIFKMVYCGQVNKAIVEQLQKLGVNAIGLSGLDGRIWEGKRKDAIRIVENGKTKILRDDYTGQVERVNTSLLKSLLESGYLPVLTPPAISYEGEAINVDGDRAAAKTAVALAANQLLILSNVPGLLENFPDEDSLIKRLAFSQLEDSIEKTGGRMRVKILAAKEAIEGGVDSVILADARKTQPISLALAGNGTVIER